MEILTIIIENIDLILIAAVVLISAVVFARRGQLQLLRELILSLSASITADELYEKLPTLTRLLISDKTVNKLVEETKSPSTSV